MFFYAIAAALVVVIVLRRFQPAVAAVLGMVVAAGIGAWGVHVYGQGGEMAFAGAVLPAWVFFAFVATLVAFEAVNLRLAFRRRGEHTPE